MAISKAERERRAAERKRKFEERKAAMDKKIREVQEGRAAGMTMTEIRAKRMNISAKELKQKQLATLLGMAEGMATFLPFGAAVKGGMLIYKGLKGAKAAKALKTAAANAKKTADAKKVSSATSSTKPRVRVKAGSSKPRTAPNTAKEAGRGGTAPKTKPRVRVKAGSNKPRTAPNTAKEAGRTKLTPKGKKLVTGAAIGTGVGLTALGLAGRSAYDSITKRDKPVKPRTAPDTSSERGRKGTPKRAGKPRTAPNVVSEAGRSGTPKRKTPKSSEKPRFAPGMNVMRTRAGTPTGEAFKKKNDRSTVATSKGKARTTPSTASEKGRKGTPKRTGKLRTAPNTVSEAGRKGTPKRTAKITAGPNVGFGPKGNQFPKDAADRRRLMAMYGGTGSAAAKAAAQGKQGNLKKGKK